MHHPTTRTVRPLASRGLAPAAGLAAAVAFPPPGPTPAAADESPVDAFAIGWASGFDVGSGGLARGVGLGAEQFLPTSGIHNTDIYRMLYATLFGEEIGYSDGRTTPAITDPSPR